MVEIQQTDSERLAVLQATYQASVEAMISKASDPAALREAGMALGQLAIEIGKLESKIARGSTTSAAVKAEALVAFQTALSKALVGDDLGPVYQAYRKVNPAAKSLVIEFGPEGAFSYKATGGMRSTGGTRTRIAYKGKGLPEEGARTKEVIAAFGRKYKQVKAYPTKENPYVTGSTTVMSQKEIQALLAAIVKGEGLTLA